MSLKLKCTGRDEKGVLTFVCTGVGYPNREFTFTAAETAVDDWSKKAVTMVDMCDAPFQTGPGIFDQPITCFALYALVMSIAGDEDLVGAEYVINAPGPNCSSITKPPP